MFTSLKNKIREETGNDLSKLTAKITNSTVQRIDSLRGRGSTSSLNSFVSSDGAKDDGSENGRYDDESKKRIHKLEQEFNKKLEEKEKEWIEILREKDKQLNSLQTEKEEAHKQISNLKETLRTTEDFKQRLVEHQEDKEQIESFQTQELSKIKHLVLLREQELEEKVSQLKESHQQIEKLRSEVNRLRRSEEQLGDVQQNAKTEIKAVRKNLENTELELEKHEEESCKLKQSFDNEQQSKAALEQIISKFKKDLNDEKANCLNVQRTLTRVTSEKNTALLRNAEISQQLELVRQEKRRQEAESNELLSRISLLESENNKYKEKETKGVEQELKSTVIVLEEQLADKNKTIKTLQLRLSDMKKTLQQELRSTSNSTSFDNHHFDAASAAILIPSQQNTTRNASGYRKDEDDVNFTYLKHVIIKFLTSREYEAQHLTKAVSTLLHFSPEEEKLLNDTLEWKMSWFGSKPKFDDKR